MLLALALAILAGCSRKPTRTDAQIAIEIQSKLYSDSAIKSREINVQAANGVVTLSGQVSDDSERAAAAGDAATVEGVKTVVNNLQVQQAEATRPKRQTMPKAPSDKPSKLYMSERQSTRTSQRPKGEDEDVRILRRRGAAITNDTAPSAAMEPSPAPAPPADAPAKSDAAPKKVTVPAGTQLTVRLDNPLDSERNQIGDTFHGSLSDAIVLDGETVIPSGADVAGRVSDVKSAGRFAGNSVLTLELTSLSVNGKTYNIQTNQWTPLGQRRGQEHRDQSGRRHTCRSGPGRHLRRRQRRCDWRGGRSWRGNRRGRSQKRAANPVAGRGGAELPDHQCVDGHSARLEPAECRTHAALVN